LFELKNGVYRMTDSIYIIGYNRQTVTQLFI